jgi:hypothetical protein
MRMTMSATLIIGLMVVGSSARSAADLPAALVDPYLQIQVALSGDSFEGVADWARAVEKAAAALGADAAAIAGGAQKVIGATDIAAARTAFGELSAAMVAYAVATKSGLGTDVRQAYCPMVNKPWLTRDKTIRNPYYGKAMSTCGVFK